MAAFEINNGSMSSGGSGKWNVLRALGQGASGATVSLAADDASGELFVVKSAASGQQLRREWAVMSGLSSPHVVRCLGFRASGCRDHLLLEYAPGGSLADVARRRGGIEEAEVRAHAADVLRALDYLHDSALVVHGDVKGGNVLLGADGRAMLADFGCAWRSTGDTGMPLGGTPAFMAPEVARGEEQGPAADVWALGYTVVEMATGGLCAPDDNVLAAVRRIGYTDDAAPAVPRWLSPAAKDFLGLCFRRRASDRPTAAQLLEHPFVAMAMAPLQPPCGLLKKKELPVSKTTWVSPTSALDAAFWESDSEADDDDDDDTSSNSPIDRIREMALSSGSQLPLPDWISSDDGWIEVCSSRN